MPKTGNSALVYLIRHATPDWERRDIPYDVPPGPSLTQHGRQEARLLAAHLANAGIRRLFSSEMARAHETATILGDVMGLPVEIEPGLIEIPNGSAAKAVSERMLDLWQRRVLDADLDGPLAMVTHGGPIASLLSDIVAPPIDLGPYKGRFDRGNPVPPAGVWEVSRRPDGSWDAILLFYPLRRIDTVTV